MSKQYVSPPLIRRPSRTLPVTILAVVLLAAGVVAIIAAIQRLQHGSLAAVGGLGAWSHDHRVMAQRHCPDSGHCYRCRRAAVSDMGFQARTDIRGVSSTERGCS